MRKILVALILGSSMLAGCASVPMASAQEDSEAKQFVTPPGKSAIYVNRGGGVGMANLFQTVVDGRVIGSISPYSYQLISVNPGDHVLYVTGTENSKRERFHTEPGSNYFFDVGVSFGLSSGRVAIEPVSEQQGRRLVTDSKRAETM